MSYMWIPFVMKSGRTKGYTGINIGKTTASFSGGFKQLLDTTKPNALIAFDPIEKLLKIVQCEEKVEGSFYLTNSKENGLIAFSLNKDLRDRIPSGRYIFVKNDSTDNGLVLQHDSMLK